MPKVKNVSEHNYTSGDFHVDSGAVADVADDKAEYLLSDACPGSFEAVKEEAVKPESKPKAGSK